MVIITVRVFPPNESRNNKVSLESINGTCSKRGDPSGSLVESEWVVMREQVLFAELLRPFGFRESVRDLERT